MQICKLNIRLTLARYCADLLLNVYWTCYSTPIGNSRIIGDRTRIGNPIAICNTITICGPTPIGNPTSVVNLTPIPIAPSKANPQANFSITNARDSAVY